MLVESYLLGKTIEAQKKKDHVPTKRLRNAALAFAIITILSFLIWILSIVSAAHCPSPNATDILLAIFIWPLYWILKWTGITCKAPTLHSSPLLR